MRTFSFALIVLMLGIVSVMAQKPSVPQFYEEPEAYQIYSLLLPQEESYGLAKGTLIIQEETASERVAYQPCLTPDAAVRFKDAVADYHRLNKESRLLQRQFHIEKDYEVVNSDTIRTLFKDGGWDSFYKRYPHSGGYVVMSAVGFNRGKTRAIVYTGSSCGGLCGSWRFHLLEKIDGHWKEVPGVNCSLFS